MSAQAPTAAVPAVRDSGAVLLVQRALASMGGEPAIGAVLTVQTSGTIDSLDGTSPISFVSSESVAGSIFAFRKETSSGQTTKVFVSGDTGPQLSIGGKPAAPLPKYVATGTPPFELPAVLLYAEFHDPTYSIRLVSSASAGSPPQIEITNNTDLVTHAIVRQDWYFDPGSGVPIRVEYNLPSLTNALQSVRAVCDFLSFKQFNGVLFPTSLDSYEDGREVGLVSISFTQINIPISPAQFQLATGGGQ